MTHLVGEEEEENKEEGEEYECRSHLVEGAFQGLGLVGDLRDLKEEVEEKNLGAEVVDSSYQGPTAVNFPGLHCSLG